MLEFLEDLFWPLWFKKPRKFIKIPPGGIVITSQYLDIHNDYIQLYLIEEDGNYFLTDDGATIGVLEDSGLLNDRKGKELLGFILKDNHLVRSGNKLWTQVDEKDIEEIYEYFISKLRELNHFFERNVEKENEQSL